MLAIEVIGNLGWDAEIKEFSGKKYVSFSVADSQTSTDSQGNRKERTTWVSVLWYGDGGRLFQYLKKGTKVFVRGRMSIKEYTDRGGEKQFAVNCSANEVTLCGIRETAAAPAQSGGGYAPANPGSQYPDTQRAIQNVRQVAQNEAAAEVDDLPF